MKWILIALCVLALASNSSAQISCNGLDIPLNSQELQALRWVSNQSSDITKTPIPKVFGVSVAQLLELDSAIGKAVIASEFDFESSKFSVSSLSDSLCEAATRAVTQLKLPATSPLLERAKAAAITLWVRTHLTYNQALPEPTVPQAVQSVYWTSATLLKAENPWAVCAGFARLTKDLADKANLTTFLTLGVIRDPGNKIPPKWTHGWNVFVFKNSAGDTIACPSDTTLSRISLTEARKRNGRIHHLASFPATAEEWGLFLWRNRITAEDGDRPIPPECELITPSEATWRTWSSTSLERLIGKVDGDLAGSTVKIKP